MCDKNIFGLTKNTKHVTLGVSVISTSSLRVPLSVVPGGGSESDPIARLASAFPAASEHNSFTLSASRHRTCLI